MNLQLQQVPDTTTQRNFERLREELLQVPPVIRTFVDASAGAVTKNLPDGDTQFGKCYHYIKTDASANSVTIVPLGAQLVMGTTSLVLVTQGDSALLAWDSPSQSWWLI